LGNGAEVLDIANTIPVMPKSVASPVQQQMKQEARPQECMKERIIFGADYGLIFISPLLCLLIHKREAFFHEDAQQKDTGASSVSPCLQIRIAPQIAVT